MTPAEAQQDEEHGPGKCVSVADANRVLAEERAAHARTLAAPDGSLWCETSDEDEARVEKVARYMFHMTAEWRCLASSEDAEFDEYVERHQEQWRDAARELLQVVDDA